MEFTGNTKLSDIMADPVFKGFGRLIFPSDPMFFTGNRLNELRLTWYGPLDTKKTVEIVRYFKDQALQRQLFYRLYTDEEILREPGKKDVGLFFFRGVAGAKAAICCAGGGFAYVGAMHDSFPHALELSKKGCNAFALIYRPGARTACEDLARAIAFLFDNAGKLAIDPVGYSLWGGSAGARMAAWVGTHGTEAFGEKRYPRPAAVIMQYTGLSEVTGHEPPTYSCVGTRDSIASWRVMDQRTRALQAHGIDAEIDVFPGLSHGFGLGLGTVAEGWLDHAARFWKAHYTDKNIRE
ncbi:MAG: alpha/beta hydrolase [Mailhella sp.]|nr:alpha/beta hydrolase [Mailhella sp.]